MGSNEGRAWVSLGGVGHVELSEGFVGLAMSIKCIFNFFYFKQIYINFCFS